MSENERLLIVIETFYLTNTLLCNILFQLTQHIYNTLSQFNNC